MAKKRGGSKEEEGGAPRADVDFYADLGVAKDATPSEVKKAYYKKALEVHPDRNPGNKSANEEFQRLAHIFDVLSDPEKRKLYDETGCDPELEDSCDGFDSWDAYFRAVFNRISEDDIVSFEKRYKNSSMEAEDVRFFYEKFEGDLAKLVEHVPLSTDEDLPRFKEYLEACITLGRVNEYKSSEVKKCTKCGRKPTKCPKHQQTVASFEQRRSEPSKPEASALTQIVSSKRKADHDRIADKLMEKYVRGQPKSRAKSGPPPISDEEFDRVQKQLETNRKQAQAKKPKR